MLTLTRRKGERLNVGLSVEITVLEISGGRVRLGISAPRRLPVHRGEVVERMELANRAALARRANGELGQEQSVLNFPEGLIGLPDHRELVLCESNDDSGLFVLVSKSDPCVQLAVVEARLVVPDYPIRDACSAADFEHEDAAVALVVTQGGIEHPTSVNLQAPIVMGLTSRYGRQVILLREDLPLRQPIELPIGSVPLAKAT
ncbi:MAG: carbon storage regulator [Polyangiales bacterium]